MGTVAVLFRVYTKEGMENAVSEQIRKTLKPTGMQLEDVAFGIKTIKVLFKHDDSEGSSVLEEKLKKISGVNEVEVVEESLE